MIDTTEDLIKKQIKTTKNKVPHGLIDFRSNSLRKVRLIINFTKINTPPWVFSRFLNCTNGTKSRNALQIMLSNKGRFLMLITIISFSD